MTVAELIEKLRAMPQDLTVRVETEKDLENLKTIEVNESYDGFTSFLDLMGEKA